MITAVPLPKGPLILLHLEPSEYLIAIDSVSKFPHMEQGVSWSQSLKLLKVSLLTGCIRLPCPELCFSTAFFVAYSLVKLELLYYRDKKMEMKDVSSSPTKYSSLAGCYPCEGQDCATFQKRKGCEYAQVRSKNSQEEPRSHCETIVAV